MQQLTCNVNSGSRSNWTVPGHVKHGSVDANIETSFCGRDEKTSRNARLWTVEDCLVQFRVDDRSAHN